ncbi:flagellar assembly protein FliH [Curvibacter sp. APW13]|uniref:FliH/SctL family protein n=1 Tax=Curvibacter sp. APW13 TaxID=3077236 RepID=UPI0028DFAD29|nr:flagellar assembly protein FliH [Curvibacter sp. APW13]MDT8992904.1 flagellar assembly protein FliH [Curvibacter sp. APW13]
MSRGKNSFIPGEDIAQVVDWSFAAVDSQSDRFAAKLRAQEMQEALQKEENLRQVGYAEGYGAGYSEGFAKGHEQAALAGQQQLDDYIAQQGQAAAERFSRLFEQVQLQLAQQEQQIAQGLLEMACEIARQVLRKELSINPNLLQPVIREALGMLVLDNRAATVRLHPVDADVLAGTVREDFAGLALNLVPDASVTPGGCMVECAGAVVDGTVEKRWQKAVARLGLESRWEQDNDVH